MRKTPGIPQDVFFDEPASQAVKTATSLAVKTASSLNVKQSSGQKVQVTIYLSEETARELERARFELLTKHDLRAPKSAIAEWAIAQATADLDALAEALKLRA